ncbi:MAG TPA: tRNA (pseudouridine(54)-N(1))-methyltransferase TrmY [Polyangiaceae bacterium]|nr:tRNA (pseudouridine(54)-N(1))-methyltransferase TrmY [Polyangiaceae bacterium]
MRRFVLIGQTASASADFSVEDLPGSSGRLDVLLRCIRAALLVSHGLRRDVQVYLVLRGGVAAPVLLRINGQSAKFLRPDERSLATLVKKTLQALPTPGDSFVEVRPGLELRAGDVPEILSEVGGSSCFVLHEQGADVRSEAGLGEDAWYFIGDHLGFDVVSLALLERHGCRRLSVGPLSLHSDDVVSLISNELDRRSSQETANARDTH